MLKMERLRSTTLTSESVSSTRIAQIFAEIFNQMKHLGSPKVSYKPTSRLVQDGYVLFFVA